MVSPYEEVMARHEDDFVRVLDAYDAMIQFLTAYWERGDRSDDNLAALLGALNRGPDPTPTSPPLDIAQWIDWIDAVEKVRASRPAAN